MSRIIAVANHKGGVGKTTTTMNVGAGLVELGKRVLLVDLDPQANLTQSLNVDAEKYNTYTLIKGNGVIPVEVRQNLYIIPSVLDLSGAEIEMVGETGREYILRENLAEYAKSFDYVLIDCPPSLGLLTVNALTASDSVILPLQSQFLAIQGLTKLWEVIEKIKKRLNKNLSVMGIVITQFDSRKILHKNVVDMIRGKYDGLVFNTMIRDNITLAESPVNGVDVFTYDDKCYGSIDYLNLCREVLER